jgi:RimJ/RimL family protein N-acetyltransferase
MSKRNIGPIEGKTVRLRTIASDDLGTMLHWRNQWRIRRNFKTSRPISLSEHEEWYRHYAGSDTDFVFLICERDQTARPVGQISLYHIDWSRHEAEFGRLMIGEENSLHRGYAKEATRLLIAYALGELALHRIYLEVFPFNAPAVTLYHRCGFRLDEYRDGMMRMSLDRDCAEEYSTETLPGSEEVGRQTPRKDDP